MTKKKKSLFSPPRFKKYARIVSYSSIGAASESVQKLESEFRDAKTRGKRTRIIKVLNLASNRARASSKKQDLKPATRMRYKQIGKVYRDAQKTLSAKNKKKRT